MMRSRAWSKKGDPANVEVHARREANVIIVGCISSYGTINFSKVEPLPRADVEKLEKEYQQHKEAVMDVLDKHNKKDMFIAMDNCKIHHTAFVVDAINKQSYKPLSMPPYYPFLNPIEECWTKIKSNMKGSPLDSSSKLIPRIIEACESVTVQDCLGWIRHSETYWGKCLNKELYLK
ncbi:hypothetical protein G6F56_010411 [Rhizopus delemar]|nr:hypothetical protein G6F56_010411 [Rhizopus delemar]